MTGPGGRPPLASYTPEDGVVVMRLCDVPEHPDIEWRWGAACANTALVYVRYRPEPTLDLTVTLTDARHVAVGRWPGGPYARLTEAARVAVAAHDAGTDQ